MVKRKRRKITPKKRIKDIQQKKVLNYKNLFINISLLFSLFLVIYLSHDLLKSDYGETKDTERSTSMGKVTENEKEDKIYKIQVLNGCGVKGIAETVTNFLRQKGFDVKEYGNYTLLGTRESDYYFDMRESIVIDRSGESDAAGDIASALGTNNIIKQLTNDLLIDVTVIIGKDYKSLLPYK